MLALLLPPCALLTPQARFRRSHAVMTARTDGMLSGETVPTELLSKLGIEGKRTVLAFFCRDDGFECQKELRDFEDRSERYKDQFGCDIVAIRSAGKWVSEETPRKFPSLRFVVDDGDELRQALRMDIDQVRDRHTFVLDVQGCIQSQFNGYPDPFAHSAMAIRTLLALDDPNNPYDAAASDPSGIAERAAKYKELYQKDIAQQLAVNAEMEKRKLERAQASPESGVDLRYKDTGPSFLDNLFGGFKKK